MYSNYFICGLKKKSLLVFFCQCPTSRPGLKRGEKKL